MYNIAPDDTLTNLITYALAGISALGGGLWLTFIRPEKKIQKIQKTLDLANRETEQIRQFPTNYPNPIIHISCDGKILFTNPAAQKIYPDLKEKGFSHPILRDIESFVEKALREPESDHTLHREINVGGFFYDQNIATISYEGEKTLIVYCYDTTTHKIFEKQLQITKDAAEVANRAKGDFLANMSHELRTPMNGIIGLSQLLAESTLNEEQKELVFAVNSSSRNLLILLNDILDLSKIEAGELTLEQIPFDIRRTVYQTVDLLKPVAKHKNVILDSVISPVIHKRIKGDPARLQQIINNLISNAIKFTEDGYVRIDVTSGRDQQDKPEIHIRVEDTGIGIPEDKREIIFHKFTQADVSTARKYGGTGLGLSITKELVQMMGGSISVDSIVEKGTTFHVRLPIEIAEMTEETSEHENNLISIDTNARILVVDDHPINLLFMRKVLKKIGFENADEACNGREAINLANEKEYRLILMDCQMPDIDGFEASTIIRESEEKIGDVKIIAVTADAMKGAREKCLDSGMNDYISKPVDIDKLKDVLSIWIPDKSSKQTTKERTEKHIENNQDKAKEEDKTKPCKGKGCDKNIMDWERLDLFTDGDPEEEKILIDLFITSADETLEVIKQQIETHDNEEWKKAAHRLKGSAANLGAKNLSDICDDAEQAYEEDEDTKRLLLRSIMASYEEVCEVLNNPQTT